MLITLLHFDRLPYDWYWLPYNLGQSAKGVWKQLQFMSIGWQPLTATDLTISINHMTTYANHLTAVCLTTNGFTSTTTALLRLFSYDCLPYIDFSTTYTDFSIVYGHLLYNSFPYINHLLNPITLQQLTAACLTTYDHLITYPDCLWAVRFTIAHLMSIPLQVTWITQLPYGHLP